jgi:hypothetical protein
MTDIVTSKQAYEDWLRIPHGQAVVAKDLQRKHEKKIENAIPFLRAT